MSKSDFEPIERALYLGRRRLGRFVQTDERQFEGFGPDDCSLGLFEPASRCSRPSETRRPAPSIQAWKSGVASISSRREFERLKWQLRDAILHDNTRHWRHEHPTLATKIPVKMSAYPSKRTY